MNLNRREFLKKVGIVTAGVAVASVAPMSLLAAPARDDGSHSIEHISNQERHFEAPRGTQLNVYKNSVLQVHNRDYRTDTHDWMGRSVVTFPKTNRGDHIVITRSAHYE